MPVTSRQPASPRIAAGIRAAIDRRLDLTLFKTLADPNRLLVLSCLIKCGRPCSVSEVAECCEIEFSVVNKHMKVLAAAGVVSAAKRGRTVWYAARCGALCERLSLLIDAIAEWCPNLEPRVRRSSGTPCCAPSSREAR